MKKVIQNIIILSINGKCHELLVGNKKGQISESETLAYTIRERLNLTGLKIGCNEGACGSCTVLINDKPVNSCMVLTLDCEDVQITTIEGLKNAETGDLSPLQKSFVKHCGYQCGFCTPGVIMVVEGLLRKNPNPSEDEVRDALAGNYCRCGTHYSAVESIMSYIEESR